MPSRLILLTLLAGFACASNETTDRLADTYVDLLRYRDRTLQADSLVVRTGVDSILAVHGFTNASYRASFVTLADDPDRLPAFFARVDQRMTETGPARQPVP